MMRNLIAIFAIFWITGTCFGYNLKDLYQELYVAEKRAGSCPPTAPFQCPSGECIPLKYLCDGSPDCASLYDENDKMCTAARRPPVKETIEYMDALLQSHGPDFFGKLFGPKGANRMKEMGGVQAVATALSESKAIDDFGNECHLDSGGRTQLREVLMAVGQNDRGVLNKYGISGSEVTDTKFYVDMLVETGFLS